jgi:acyl-coenzyme A thioesterase PaaI-like protein
MTPIDPDFHSRIQDVFFKQTVMRTIGARAGKAEPGLVEIELPYDEKLAQHHGYLHAGIVTTIADSACGGAALTL